MSDETPGDTAGWPPQLKAKLLSLSATKTRKFTRVVPGPQKTKRARPAEAVAVERRTQMMKRGGSGSRFGDYLCADSANVPYLSRHYQLTNSNFTRPNTEISRFADDAARSPALDVLLMLEVNLKLMFGAVYPGGSFGSMGEAEGMLKIHGHFDVKRKRTKAKKKPFCSGSFLLSSELNGRIF